MKRNKVLQNIFSYCDRATIGVLKYISRKSLTKVERIFWIVCMIFVVISSIFLIDEAVDKFLAHKVAVKISDKRHDVSEIPFPALSICPELLVSNNSLVRNLSHYQQ